MTDTSLDTPELPQTEFTQNEIAPDSAVPKEPSQIGDVKQESPKEVPDTVDAENDVQQKLRARNIDSDSPGFKELNESSAKINPDLLQQGFWKSFNIQRKVTFDTQTLTGIMSNLSNTVTNSINTAKKYGITPSDSPPSLVKAIKQQFGDTASDFFMFGSNPLTPLLTVTIQEGKELLNRMNFLHQHEPEILSAQQQNPNAQQEGLATVSQIVLANANHAQNLQHQAEISSNNADMKSMVGGWVGSFAAGMQDPVQLGINIAAAFGGGAVKLGDEIIGVGLKKVFMKTGEAILNSFVDNVILSAVQAVPLYEAQKKLVDPNMTKTQFANQQVEQILAGTMLSAGISFASHGLWAIGHSAYAKILSEGEAHKYSSETIETLKQASDMSEGMAAYMGSDAAEQKVTPDTFAKAYVKAAGDVYQGKDADVSEIIPGAEKPMEPNPITYDKDLPINNEALDEDTSKTNINTAIKLLKENPELKPEYEETLQDKDGNDLAPTTQPSKEFLENSAEEIKTLENTVKCMRGGA